MNLTNPPFLPLEYMARTRAYYAAQGFDQFYQWAHSITRPLLKISKPLSECNITFVTTAVPDGTIPKMKRAASSHLISEMPENFRTDELSWDKEATHTRDRNSYIPLKGLRQLLEEGVIGSIAKRYHFVPTEYSQRNTIEKDAPSILKACNEDQVDIAILVPL